MHIKDVPLSREMRVASEPYGIQEALEEIVGPGGSFGYWQPIEGLPFSGRLFTVANHQESVAFEKPMTPRQIALEINGLDDVRYAKRPVTDRTLATGWSVRRSTVHGRPAAILFATWC